MENAWYDDQKEDAKPLTERSGGAIVRHPRNFDSQLIVNFDGGNRKAAYFITGV